MTSKRTWVFFGLVGLVAGLSSAVKSGRLGGSGGSPVPIMMTPAVTISDAPNATPSGAKADRNGANTAAIPPVLAETSRVTAKPEPVASGRVDVRRRATASSGVAGAEDDRIRPVRSPLPAEPQSGNALDSDLKDQVSDRVRTGQLAGAHELLRKNPSNPSAAAMHRLLDDLERDLLEIGNHRKAGDWYQVNQVLERLDRLGRMVPRPDLPVVVEARAWSESQRRLRASQKEWRLALEEALRWENRSRIRALLDVRDYPEDPVRAKAKEHLEQLERLDKQLVKIQGLMREERLTEAGELLSALEVQQRPDAKGLRAELDKRKAELERRIKIWASELESNAQHISRADFEEFLRQIPTAQQTNATLKRAISEGRRRIEARDIADASRSRLATPSVPLKVDPVAHVTAPVASVTNAPVAKDLDETKFKEYSALLLGRGSLATTIKSNMRDFLTRYKLSHPEKKKEVLDLLDRLRNF